MVAVAYGKYGVLYPFLPVYLKAYLQLPSLWIGVLTMLFPMCIAAVAPLITGLADTCGKHKEIFLASQVRPAPCTLHPAPCTMHRAPCILHVAPYTLLAPQLLSAVFAVALFLVGGNVWCVCMCICMCIRMCIRIGIGIRIRIRIRIRIYAYACAGGCSRSSSAGHSPTPR